LPGHVKELTLSLEQGLFPGFIKRDSFQEIQSAIRMLPSIFESKLNIEKVKIKYMTYFEDLADFDELVDKLHATNSDEYAKPDLNDPALYSLRDALGDPDSVPRQLPQSLSLDQAVSTMPKQKSEGN